LGSERDFVVDVTGWRTGGAAATATGAAVIVTAIAAAVIPAIIATAAAAAVGAATAAAAIAAVKQGQFAAIGPQHHFGRVPVLTGLILPFAGFELTFDIDLRSLAQILLGNAGKRFGENGDAVPFRALLAFAGVAVFPGLGRGDPQVSHLAAVLECAHFRIAAKIADDDDLVD
jgi:hypothetical protein